MEQADALKIIDEFSSYLQAEKLTSEGTVRLYIKIISRFFSFCITHSRQLALPKNWELDDLRLRDLEAFLNHDTKHNSTRHETRVTYLTGIRTFFRYLFNQRRLSSNPIQHYTLLRGHNEICRIKVPPCEIKQYLKQINCNQLSGLRSKLLIELAYGHGMNAVRLASIQDIQQIDTSTAKIKFKDKSVKDIPTAENFEPILKKYRRMRDENAVLVEREYRAFWIDQKGRKMNAAAINRSVNKTLQEIGLGVLNIRSLRELSSQQFADAGADIRSLQKMRSVRGLRRMKSLYKKDFEQLQERFAGVHQRNNNIQ